MRNPVCVGASLLAIRSEAISPASGLLWEMASGRSPDEIRERSISAPDCIRATRKSLCKPVTIGEEVLGQARLLAARLRLPVVAPAHMRRQRHEDRLGTPAGLQAEQGAAVEHQVGFHVATTTEGLELALAFAEGGQLAALHDGQVGLQIGITDGAHEGEAGVEVPFVEVVEEQPADAAWLTAVLEVEIAVAPGLELRIDLGTERRAGVTGQDRKST